MNFHGVNSQIHLTSNGRWVGYPQHSRYPTAIHLSPIIHPGQNRIAAMVLRSRDGTYMEENQMCLSLIKISRCRRTIPPLDLGGRRIIKNGGGGGGGG
ncbi:sugar-binding domain-containing protein, partial [Enterobacter hormaechei]